MRVTAAFLARYAETDPESGLLNILGGGVDVFGVRRLPSQIPVSFALQLRYDEQEADAEHELSFIVRGPQLAAVGEPTLFTVRPALGEYHAPGWEGIYSVAGTVDLYVEEAGGHSVSVQIEGVEAGTIPFQVVHVTE